MSHPKMVETTRAELLAAERFRKEIERHENVLRLVGYNNRRILRGLRPLDFPAALTRVNRPFHL